ncbi:hypothetical protein INR49_005303 [Caranx melampygus]|nr:hypothetical protein INR49_005303 [Caranx melampygus]
MWCEECDAVVGMSRNVDSCPAGRPGLRGTLVPGRSAPASRAGSLDGRSSIHVHDIRHFKGAVVELVTCQLLNSSGGGEEDNDIQVLYVAVLFAWQLREASKHVFSVRERQKTSKPAGARRSAGLEGLKLVRAPSWPREGEWAEPGMVPSPGQLTASSAPAPPRLSLPHHRQPPPCHTRTWDSSNKTSPPVTSEHGHRRVKSDSAGG